MLAHIFQVQTLAAGTTKNSKQQIVSGGGIHDLALARDENLDWVDPMESMKKELEATSK